jgi:hypothetical protein
MTFHCSACGHDARLVDHEVVRAPDGRCLRVPRHDAGFWTSLGLTRERAIAERRLAHVSPWLCLDRDCGRIVEHERAVLPGVLGWWAGVLLAGGVGAFVLVALLGPVLLQDVLRPRHAMQAGLAVAVLLWLLGMAVVGTFSEAAGRLRHKGDWTPVRPGRCTQCGSRRLQPLILPRRAAEAAGRERPGARGLACPACRGRTMWYAARWVV